MRNKILFALLTISLILSTCSCGKTPAENSEEEVALDYKTYFEQLKVEEFEDEEQQKEYELYSVGAATITVDEERTASGYYQPIQDGLKLQLTDSEGNEWSLAIPANALPHGETITMQAAAEIDTELGIGEANGVVLLPEGLQFTIPATLSVIGPTVSDDTFCLSGSQSGENLNLLENKKEEQKLSMELSHFSSYLIVTPVTDGEFQAALGMAQTDYKEAVREARAMLKEPVSLPLLPPNYEFTCPEEDGNSGGTNRALDMYVARVLLPESEVIKKLLGAGHELSRAGEQQEAIYFAQLLEMRNLKKADQLIRNYKNDVKKLIPVMNVTMKVLKQAQSLGMDVDNQYYFGVLSEWMDRAAEDQIRKIKEDHSYKALGAAIALIQGSLIMSSDYQISGEYSQKYLKKLKDAMTFTVSYKAEAKLHGEVVFITTLKGKAVVSWLDENNEKYYQGTGEGNYTSYQDTDIPDVRIDLPNTYPVTVKFLNFTPCSSETIDVLVDTIGAPTEYWYNEAIDERWPDTDVFNFVNHTAEAVFNKYKTDGGYLFKVPYRSGRNPLEENFSESGEVTYEEGTLSGSLIYEITIEHTPR